MILGLAALLVGCGLPAAPDRGSSTDAALLLAEMRWQSRHPARYRLVVQEDTDTRSCRQSVEVHNEQVQMVLEDHCGRATPWTVSSLLDWIGERARASSDGALGSLVSACRTYQSARAVYDPALGYPYSAMYQRTRVPNWRYLRPLRQLFGASITPLCAQPAGDGAITIRIVSLTVLP
jgi:hypothetical protein